MLRGGVGLVVGLGCDGEREAGFWPREMRGDQGMLWRRLDVESWTEGFGSSSLVSFHTARCGNDLPYKLDKNHSNNR